MPSSAPSLHPASKPRRDGRNFLIVSGDSTAAQGVKSPFLYVLKELGQYWDRIDVLCPRRPGTQPLQIGGNVHIHPAPRGTSKIGRFWHSWFIVAKGRALCRERSYLLISSHDYFPFYNSLGSWILSRIVGVPFMCNVLGIPGTPRAHTLGQWLLRGTYGIFVRWVRDKVLVIAVDNRKEGYAFLLKNGVPPEKIFVRDQIFLNFDIFRPRPLKKVYDAIFCGRFTGQKGLFLLLDAVEKVRAQFPTFRLALVGGGRLFRRVQRDVRARGLEGHLEFLGWVPWTDVAEAFNRAKMFLCTSLYEGGPRVALEAMACGLPLITTPVGKTTEVVVDGVNGFFTDWDAEDIAAKILTLLRDEKLRQEMGERARLSVEDFEFHRSIRRYAEGCYRLMGESLVQA